MTEQEICDAILLMEKAEYTEPEKSVSESSENLTISVVQKVAKDLLVYKDYLKVARLNKLTRRTVKRIDCARHTVIGGYKKEEEKEIVKEF